MPETCRFGEFSLRKKNGRRSGVNTRRRSERRASVKNPAGSVCVVGSRYTALPTTALRQLMRGEIAFGSS